MQESKRIMKIERIRAWCSATELLLLLLAHQILNKKQQYSQIENHSSCEHRTNRSIIYTLVWYLCIFNSRSLNAKNFVEIIRFCFQRKNTKITVISYYWRTRRKSDIDTKKSHIFHGKIIFVVFIRSKKISLTRPPTRKIHFIHSMCLFFSIFS